MPDLPTRPNPQEPSGTVPSTDADRIHPSDTDHAHQPGASHVHPPDTDRTHPPGASRAHPSDADHACPPDAGRVHPPDADHACPPGASRVQRPDAGRVRLPGAGGIRLRRVGRARAAGAESARPAGAGRRSWPAVALGVAAVAWGANQFAPLLLMYRSVLGVPATTVQATYALYAAGLIPGLLLGGPLSDRYGRRRVLAPALLISALASGLLMLAGSGSAWLFAGRLVAGAASGAAFSSGTAWIKELTTADEHAGDTGRNPRPQGRDAQSGARRATIAMTAGFALGPLIAGLSAQWAPHPELTAYVPHVALTLAALPLVLRTPDPRRTEGAPSARHPTRHAVDTRLDGTADPARATPRTPDPRQAEGGRPAGPRLDGAGDPAWRRATPRTPDGRRAGGGLPARRAVDARRGGGAGGVGRRFWVVVVPMAPWVFGASSIALAYLPGLVRERLGGGALVFGAVVTMLTMVAGIVVQPLARRADRPGTPYLMVTALGIVAGGLVLAAVAAASAQWWLVAAAALVLGAGYGCCLVCGLTEVQRLAGPANLGRMTAVFQAVAYLGFGAPYVLAVAERVLPVPGLLLLAAVLALLTLAWTARRPARSEASAPGAANG